ncbi:hypothetical protein FQA39_LY01267 [Lamprigera yunnana]|nr:hypothetical protein FQA39_LY01267 [Lamprigera yunnana]
MDEDSLADLQSSDNRGTDNGTNVSNLYTTDIDAETKEKLRGDAIGSTMYSETFVTKTLLQFKHLQWSEKLEEDLCFLWDMTLEKEVCDYLLKLSYSSIVCDVIHRFDENRLIEIVIGILANICCTVDTAGITDEQAQTILTMLDVDDSLILIQVTRFIKALAYDREQLLFIDDETVAKLNFILINSCHIELLLNTLDAVSKMTSDNKLDSTLIRGELITSSVIAFQCICKIEQERLSLLEDELETNQQRTALTYLIQIVTNICSYINTDNKNNEFSIDINKHIGAFVDELSKILNYYSRDECLLPVSEELQFYAKAFIFIFQVLNITYNKFIFTSCFRITHILLKNKCEETELFLEFCNHFLYVGKLDNIKLDLSCFENDNVLDILKNIVANKATYDFIIQHQSVKYNIYPLSPLSRHRLSIVKRKVLVLDLDETLIHSHHDGVVRQTVRPGTPPDFVLKVVIDRHPVRFFVHKRPHVDFFLDIVSQWYDLVVFTASMEIYGAAVADRLDAGRGILQRRYYRQHCTPDLGSYTKDLSAICNDLSSIFILDNSPGAYRAYPDNAIPIKSWFSDPTDIALLNLLPVLDALRFTADVRSVLSRNLHLHRLCENQRENNGSDPFNNHSYCSPIN